MSLASSNSSASPKKVLAVGVTSLLLLGGGAGAIQIHDSLDFLSDAVVCNPMMSWLAVNYCDPVDNIEFNADNTDSLMNSIYTSGLVQQDNRNQTTTNQLAYIDTMYGTGMAEAKVAMIESMNAGDAYLEANSNATSVISNFYSVQQSQIYKNRNREVVNLKAGFDRAMEDSQIRPVTTYRSHDIPGSNPVDMEGMFRLNGLDNADSCSNTVQAYKDVRYINGTVELYNGTSTKAVGLEVEIKTTHTDSNGDCIVDDSYSNRTLITASIGGGMNGGAVAVNDQNYENPVLFTNGARYAEVLNELDSRYNNALSEKTDMVEKFYNSYNAGDINSSDIQLGPLEMLKTASTNYEDTGASSYLAVTSEMAGLASNSSYAFNVSWDSHEAVWGQVYVPSEGFNDTLRAGETYSVGEDIVEIVYDTENGAERVRVDNNFTIHSMENPQTGVTVNKTSLESAKFYSGDVTDLQEQIDRLNKLNEQAGGSNTFGFSFGGFDFSLTPKQRWTVLAVLAIVAVVVAV